MYYHRATAAGHFFIIFFLSNFTVLYNRCIQTLEFRISHRVYYHHATAAGHWPSSFFFTNFTVMCTRWIQTLEFWISRRVYYHCTAAAGYWPSSFSSPISQCCVEGGFKPINSGSIVECTVYYHCAAAVGHFFIIFCLFQFYSLCEVGGFEPLKSGSISSAILRCHGATTQGTFLLSFLSANIPVLSNGRTQTLDISITCPDCCTTVLLLLATVS